MPVYDFSSGFNSINQGIRALGDTFKEQQKRDTLVALGQAVKSGDYNAAADIAAQSGSPDLMLGLVKLGQQRQDLAEFRKTEAAGPPSRNGAALASPTASASSSAAPVASGGGISPFAPKAAGYFLSNGVVSNPLGAAALAAGFQAESKYDPSAVAKGDGRDGSDAINIGQWNSDRAVDFRNFYQANKLDPSDPQTGLAFARYELQNKPEYAGVVSGLNAAKTPEEAQAAAISYWKPAGWTAADPTAAKDFTRRLNYTRAIAGAMTAPTAVASAPLAQATPDASANPTLPPGATSLTMVGGNQVGPGKPLAPQGAPAPAQLASAGAMPAPDLGAQPAQAQPQAQPGQPGSATEGIGAQPADAVKLLQAKGVPPTPIGVLLVQKLGAPVASQILVKAQSAPDTPMTEIMPDVGKQYPNVAQMSVGQFYAGVTQSKAGGLAQGSPLAAPQAPAGGAPAAPAAGEPQAVPAPAQAPPQAAVAPPVAATPAAAPGAPAIPFPQFGGKAFTRADAVKQDAIEANAGPNDTVPDVPNSQEWDAAAAQAQGASRGTAAPQAAVPQIAQQQAAVTAQLPPAQQAAAARAAAQPPSRDVLNWYLRMQAMATNAGDAGSAAKYKTLAELEAKSLEPTAEQRNFEYAQRNPGFEGFLTKDKTPQGQSNLQYAQAHWQELGLPDPSTVGSDPRAKEQWSSMAAKALGMSAGALVEVHTGENETAKKLADIRTLPIKEAAEQGAAATQQRRTLSVMKDAFQYARDHGGELPEGRLGDTVQAMRSYAKSLGLDAFIDLSNVSQGDVVEKMNAVLAAASAKTINQRGGTQFEFKTFLQNNPGLTQTAEGRMNLIDILDQDAARSEALRRIASRSDTTPDNFFQRVDQYDTDHPLVSPWTGKPLVTGERVPGAGGAPAPVVGQLPKFASPGDPGLAKLKSGDHFLDANGNERIKP